MVKELEFHPIANIFPLMQGKAFEELCEDIKANGLLEPIWLYEGKILDGRNRYRGCDEIGYELKETDFRTYEGDDPYSFVGSLNVHRRHLTVSQRAMMVADLATGRFGMPQPGDITARQAGAIVGVSHSAVNRARSVKARGVPALQRAVEEGSLGLKTAERVSGLAPEKQKTILLRVPASSSARPEMRSSRALDRVIQEVAPGTARLLTPAFIRDLDEMAVRILDFFTAPQIDILWDTIAKKQAELIKARKEKR